MLFRTEEQKKDLIASWHRQDRAFFAAGACHVLAYEFLKRAEAQGFRAFMIKPELGFRGGHVFASNERVAFDYHGWSDHQNFIGHFLRKIQRVFPGWRGSIVDISKDFWSEKWFLDTNSREPHHYHIDPTERANSFINRFMQHMPSRV